MSKRRANGEGTIRKRIEKDKSIRWEARYYDPRDDKRHSIYGKTQTIVRERLREKQKEIENDKNIPNVEMTFDNWFQIWIERYTGNVKPLTYDSYKSIYRNHIQPYIGNVVLTELDIDRIQLLYNTLYEGTKNETGLSAKTIHNVHCVIHKSLEQAQRNKYIACNPSSYCVLPRIVKPEIHPLEENDIKQFLELIESSKYADIYFLTLFTGMRLSEVLGLTWSDIDFDNGEIRISKQLQKRKYKDGEYFLGSPKNNKPRYITPASYIMTMLQRHKKEQEECKKILGTRWCGDKLSNDFVFTKETGEHLNHVTVYKHYKIIMKQMNLDCRFHDLRHSFATISLRNGDDIKTVQEALGHHAAAFTLDIYGHVTKKMARDSAARMENFIEGMKNDI